MRARYLSLFCALTLVGAFLLGVLRLPPIFGSESSALRTGTVIANTQQTATWSAALVQEAKAGVPFADARRQEYESFIFWRERPRPMPLAMRALVRRTLGSQHVGLNMDHARYRSVGAAGGLWIVNGSGITCVVRAQRGALACDTMTNVNRKGLMLGVFKRSNGYFGKIQFFLALGIAPDWARSVRLKVGDLVRSVHIDSNAYVARASMPVSFGALEGRQPRG